MVTKSYLSFCYLIVVTVFTVVTVMTVVTVVIVVTVVTKKTLFTKKILFANICFCQKKYFTKILKKKNCFTNKCPFPKMYFNKKKTFSPQNFFLTKKTLKNLLNKYLHQQFFHKRNIYCHKKNVKHSKTHIVTT